MRIVGGALAGRIFGRVNPGTRPTSDRVREAVGSLVSARRAFEGAAVLDLFAGTGGYGLEALSRGAAHALFVEKERRAVEDIRASLSALGLAARGQVLPLALSLAEHTPTRLPEGTYDLVFVDPPYVDIEGALRVVQKLHAESRLNADALVLVEHATRDKVEVPSGFVEVTRKRYGDTSILLLELG
jgi:16S rRNA (guanine966-N2)-methyltransferase